MFQLQKERKFLEDKLQEVVHQQQDEGEKLKNLLRLKTKQESQCADLEERLKREIEVENDRQTDDRERCPCSFSFVRN